jgi:hypothetical protein
MILKYKFSPAVFTLLMGNDSSGPWYRLKKFITAEFWVKYSLIHEIVSVLPSYFGIIL